MSTTPQRKQPSDPHRRKRQVLWTSVAASMAVVVGLWGMSLKNRLAQTNLGNPGAALDAAFDEFRASREEFARTALSNELPSPSRTTSTKQSNVILEIKNRLLR